MTRTGRPRWRTPAPQDVDRIRERLVAWPAPTGGAVRHMFPLASIDGYGPEVAKEAVDGDRWALAIVFPGRLVVPCGDGSLIEELGTPARRWRLLVGDAEAADPVLGATRSRDGLRVHRQTFMVVDPEAVPDSAALPDPGVRRATVADLDTLAQLAVRLHVDDEFGPDPGRSGARGYAQRLREGIDRGIVWCVGPVGRPVCKLEWAVSSLRWGTQIAGVVVQPGARGEGLGRAAVAASVRAALRRAALAGQHPDAATVTLHVRHANAGARRAYRAAGFVEREDWRLAVRA